MKPVDTDPAKVVSIEVAARWNSGAQRKCEHRAVTVDRQLEQLTCRDCGERLNAIEWIALLSERWAQIQRRYVQYRAARMALEARCKARCEHCGRMTKLRPPNSAEVARFTRVGKA